MRPLPQQTSKKDDWGTPNNVLLCVERTFLLQRIYLDPASSEEHNKVVQAINYYSPENGEDGLTLPWKAPTVFVNPPGGKVKNQSRQLLWWKKCVEEYRLRHFSEGVFLGFTIELLRLSQSHDEDGASAFDFPFCVPSRRLSFRGPGTQPAHANVIVYLGEHHKKFAEVFDYLGRVSLPHR